MKRGLLPSKVTQNQVAPRGPFMLMLSSQMVKLGRIGKYDLVGVRGVTGFEISKGHAIPR